MSRVKIPSKIVSQVIFDSDRTCCVCNKRGHQIHHLNGNNENNNLDNLVFLCLLCHNDAEVKGGLSRKLDKETIVRYRELNYERVRIKRENVLKRFSVPINSLSTEQLLTIHKNAIILIDLKKIKEEYFNAKPALKSEILEKLNFYAEFTNFRVAIEVYDVLLSIADQTRSSSTKSDIVNSILSLIISFFPHPDTKEEYEKVIELAEQCIQIAFAISYDSTIYLKNLTITMFGLTIYKYIYRKAIQLQIPILQQKVLNSYDELEATLQRPERNDLVNSLRLVKEFRNDLDETGLAFPVLPQDLMDIINSYKNEGNNV